MQAQSPRKPTIARAACASSKLKGRVIIKHANGAEESLEGVENQDVVEVTMNSPWCVDSPSNCDSRSCASHSFVQVESDEINLYIDRSGRSKRTDQLHPLVLHVPRERNGKGIVLSGEGCIVCR